VVVRRLSRALADSSHAFLRIFALLSSRSRSVRIGTSCVVAGGDALTGDI